MAGGPAGEAITQTASWSQSMRSSTSFKTLPELSPFFHRLARERDQKWTSPVSTVSRSASSFMCATISSAPLAASVTQAVIRPAASYLGSRSSPVSRISAISPG